MRLRVSPRLPRLLAVCLCSLALASAALVGTGVATSHVAHAATAPNTAIRCGTERHDPSQFSGSFGGYVGYDSQGNYCNGSFSYVLLDYLQELTQVELSSHAVSHFYMAEDAIGLAV